jgi:hypothetical protein
LGRPGRANRCRWSWKNAGAISGEIAAAQGVQQPFGVQRSCDFNASITCGVIFQVPASSRLVIEFVTANRSAVAGSPFIATLRTTVSPNAAANYYLQPQDHTCFKWSASR